MRRGRLFLLLGLVLIVLIGAVAILLPRLAGGGGETQVPLVPEVQPTPTPVPLNVVITTQRIARSEVISEDVVTMVSISRDDPVAGLLITDMTQVIGMRARYDMEPGVFLTPAMIVDSIEGLSSYGSDAALQIPPGQVAVSIPISRLSAVAFGLRKGDHVNVIMTAQLVDLDVDFQSILPNYSSAIIAPGPSIVLGSGTEEGASASVTTDELMEILTAQIISGGAVSPIGRVDLNETLSQPFHVVPSEPQRPRLVSQTLVQNAIVLQVGSFKTEEDEAYEKELAEQAAQPTPTPDPANPEAVPAEQVAPEKPLPPDVITLIVSPQDAVALNYAMFSGAQLTLAMRSARDEGVVQTEAVTLQFLLNQYNIPLPLKLPYGFEPRVDQLQLPPLRNDAVTP